MSVFLVFILWGIFSYFCGSIPFGLLLTKFAGLGDIRNIGSGNIGATNVLRTGRKTLALFTLLLDGVKAIVPIVLVLFFYKNSDFLSAEKLSWFVGFAAILGHMFPVWLKGKGGKGVATSAAVVLLLAPLVFVCAISAWIVVFIWKRTSSLAALAALIFAVIAGFIFQPLSEAFLVLALAILVLSRHRSNIERLLAGREGKF